MRRHIFSPRQLLRWQRIDRSSIGAQTNDFPGQKKLSMKEKFVMSWKLFCSLRSLSFPCGHTLSLFLVMLFYIVILFDLFYFRLYVRFFENILTDGWDRT